MSDYPKLKPESFIRKTANEWIEEAKNKPAPKMLFSEFWHEGELCILFSDTNLGKTILAVQIADSIASGKPIGMCQPVIRLSQWYFTMTELASDAELSTIDVNDLVENLGANIL